MLSKEVAIEALRKLLEPGADVYTMTVHSAKGGASHHAVLIATTSSQGENFKPVIRDITYLVALALGRRRSDRTCGIIMGGYGYSRSFQIVYDLGHTLWPDGTPEPHGTRNGEPDRDGGYALNHRSL